MVPSFNLGYFHTQKSRNKYNEILTTVKFKWCAYMWLFATLFLLFYKFEICLLLKITYN